VEQVNPQQNWCRAAGPRIVAASTNPKIGFHQGPSSASQSSTVSQEEEQMDQIYDRVAGLDVHRDSVTACFRHLGPRGGVIREKEQFTTTTAGLSVLAAWLADRHVELVAMESTGVYWKPLLLRPRASFHAVAVPPPPIRELRELTRYRKTQIDGRVAEIQRLEKVLQDAGIKLTSVASKVLTQSGRAMIESLIAGEQDPEALAELAKGKMRSKIPALTEALNGHFSAHHAVACRQILDHVDFFDDTIAVLTEQISARTSAFDAVYGLLSPIPGLDRFTRRRTGPSCGPGLS
jgi:transposase